MIQKRSELDSSTCELNGTILIEAAAGTGKTYNIQTLVLRLLLLREIPIEKILVVTFTDFATMELRERISAIISQTYQVVSKPERFPKAEPRIQKALLEVDALNHREKYLDLLGQALMNFDASPISTIHSFCSAMLTRNAFESGVLFKTELHKDSDEITYSIIDQCYRRLIYLPERKNKRVIYQACNESGLKDDGSVKTIGSLAHFRGLLKPFVERKGLLLEIPNESVTADDIEALANEVIKAYHPELVVQLNEVLLKKGREIIGMANRYLTDPSASFSPELLCFIGFFELENLKNYVGKRKDLPDFSGERFFDLIPELSRKIAICNKRIIQECIDECRCALEDLKQRENFQTFNDLLTRLHSRLQEENSPLADKICSLFSAVIVDEFQDTDDIQFEIFQRSFQKKGRLFIMVGDPRQAIYSFRGGDIFTYRKAIESCDCVKSLNENYRSDERLVHAVNEIFAAHSCPFADSQIGFEPVRVPDSTKKDAVPYLLFKGDVPEKPLSFVRVAESFSATVSQIVNAAEQICAGEIASMLANPDWSTCKDGKTSRLQPSDIAVLCRVSQTGIRIHDELAKYGIPSVISKVGNLFDTEEALDLLHVLQAINNPADRKSFTAALSGNIVDFPLEHLPDIVEGGANERTLQDCRNIFYSLKKYCRNGSFIGLFEKLFEIFDVRRRLLQKARGERIYTNYIQLRDVLNAKGHADKIVLDDLILFLLRQCEKTTRINSDEYELILETDRSVVNILTIHAAKGLGFPVVMLPDMSSMTTEGRGCLYHKDDILYKLTEEKNTLSPAAQIENLQENLRLAYVALTRAKNYCRVYYSEAKKDSRTVDPAGVFDWLFRFKKQGSAAGNDMKQLVEKMHTACADGPLSELIPMDLQDDAMPPIPPDIQKNDIPELIKEIPPLNIRIRNRALLSFSALVHGGNNALQQEHEEDPVIQKGTMVDRNDPIFSFHGGTLIGTAWHEIMEKIDFSASAEMMRPLVKYIMNRYGLLTAEKDEERIDVITRQTETVLNVLLTPSTGVPFKLRDIPPSQRMTEMDYNYFFSGNLPEKAIFPILDQYVQNHFGKLNWNLKNPSADSGMVTGILDLLIIHDGKFYILDWKSNTLGCSFASFEKDHLKMAIFETRYFVQYLLYSCALLKFLKMRIPGLTDREIYDQYFGGVFYVFLRGVNDAGRGIYYDRPEFEILQQLIEVTQ